MKINHDIQHSDGKLKHFLNINNLPKSIIEDIINRAEEFHDNSKIIKYTGKVMIAVNHEYVEQDHLLNHEDEIAFFPPVTGG